MSEVPGLATDMPEGSFRALLGIACSGGGDSVGLAVHAVSAGHTVALLHVHHHLRPGAHQDEEVVRALGSELGVPVWVYHADPMRLRSIGGGVESAARTVRYEGLTRLAARSGCGRVWLAHTAEDVLEGVVIRVARGGGLLGALGIRDRFERGGIVFERPWIAHPRASLREQLSSIETRAVDDPMNTDMRYLRARARAGVSRPWTTIAPEHGDAWVDSMSQIRRDVAAVHEMLAERSVGLVHHIQDRIVIDRALFADSTNDVTDLTIRALLRAYPGVGRSSIAQIRDRGRDRGKLGTLDLSGCRAWFLRNAVVVTPAQTSQALPSWSLGLLGGERLAWWGDASALTGRIRSVSRSHAKLWRRMKRDQVGVELRKVWPAIEIDGELRLLNESDNVVWSPLWNLLARCRLRLHEHPEAD